MPGYRFARRSWYSAASPTVSTNTCTCELFIKLWCALNEKCSCILSYKTLVNYIRNKDLFFLRWDIQAGCTPFGVLILCKAMTTKARPRKGRAAKSQTAPVRTSCRLTPSSSAWSIKRKVDSNAMAFRLTFSLHQHPRMLSEISVEAGTTLKRADNNTSPRNQLQGCRGVAGLQKRSSARTC